MFYFIFQILHLKNTIFQRKTNNNLKQFLRL
jgi:hypothetical protein